MPETYSAGDRGFTMPAEWEDQHAILLSWPLNPATWEDRREAVEAVYHAGIGRLLFQHQMMSHGKTPLCKTESMELTVAR